MAQAIISNQLYSNGMCIPVKFVPDDLGGENHYASATFVFDDSFHDISDGSFFTIFGKNMAANDDIDLSGSSWQDNVKLFADMLYEIFEFSGLYAPPASYGEDTYIINQNDGEIKIVWNESGFIDPFEFDVSELQGVVVVADAGQEFDGKLNYGIVFRIYKGHHPITETQLLPLIYSNPPKLASLDLATLYGMVSLRDFVDISDNITIDDEPNIYADFYLRYSSRSQAKGCTIDNTPFKKSAPIHVYGLVCNNEFCLSSNVTTLCHGREFQLIFNGTADNVEYKYSFHGSPNLIKNESCEVVDNTVSVPSGYSIFANHLFGVTSLNGEPLISQIKSVLITAYNGDVEVDSHLIVISDCDCCEVFYFKENNGGWRTVCMTKVKTSSNAKRVSTCSGCSNTTTIVLRSSDIVEYEGEQNDLLDVFNSDVLYKYENNNYIAYEVTSTSYSDGNIQMKKI